MEEKPNPRRYLPVILGLILITLAAYSQVYRLDFVNYDDGAYVDDNPYVIQGLTLNSVKWALTNYCAGNWHPLTMLSLMLDVELFGVNPAAHHAVNLLFHLANAILVFVVFARATNRIWPCALIAALFAVHPLHVESVAWISERKDVLSAFFGFLAIGAYFRYARKPGLGGYLAVFGLMALSLSAKAMLVTLPGLLLLMDIWPLGRLDLTRPGRLRSGIRLSWEKAPLLVLSLAFSLVTIWAQHAQGAMQPLSNKPLDLRLMNAAQAYILYLVKTVWPVDLAVFYPYPEIISIYRSIGFAALVAIITVIAFIARRKPYFMMGWLWYLVSLMPVIGIVQVGMQSHADRYTYLPIIGIFALAAFALDDASRSKRISPRFAFGVAGAVILTLTFMCHRQAAYWKNTETLFRHALASTKNNDQAHKNLGIYLLDAQRFQEAKMHLESALAISSTDWSVHQALSEIYHQLKKTTAAEKHLQSAIRLAPDTADSHFLIGVSLRLLGHLKEAELHFRRSVELEPTAKRHNFLGVCLAQQNRLDEAEQEFLAALKLDPRESEARSNLEKLRRLKSKNPAAHDLEEGSPANGGVGD